MLNVSESGIAVQAAEALDVNDGPLAMRIEIPRSRKRLEVTGEIVWVGESRKEAGLRFVDLSEDALKRIRSWMAREDSPGTAAEESEEEVEAPAFRAAEVRAESVVTSETLAEREDRVAKAEELAAQDQDDRGELDALAEGEEAVVESGEEFCIEELGYRGCRPTGGSGRRCCGHDGSAGWCDEGTCCCGAGRREGRRSPANDRAAGFDVREETAGTNFRAHRNQRHARGAGLCGGCRAARAVASCHGRFRGDFVSDAARCDRTPLPPDDGWKSFRVQLQTGWFLAALVLLLATISFVAGMAVRRGALNAVMGDVDDVAQPKSASAPAPSVGNVAANSSGSGAGATAATAPAKPLQIEIVDLENHRWTIPAASGANGLRRTPVNDGAPPDASAPASSASSASNLLNRNSGPGTSPADGVAVAARPGEPLMLSFPETPISASGSVAIRATGVVAVPAGDAQSAQHARNLQIGELINLVEPVYPPDARQARLEGTVKLHVVVGTNGEVESFHPVSGPESLTHAAMIAVREWRYRPTLLNGKAVQTQEDVTFVFRLPN